MQIRTLQPPLDPATQSRSAEPTSERTRPGGPQRGIVPDPAFRVSLSLRAQALSSAPSETQIEEGTESEKLSREEEQEVAALKRRDREVRAHEAAHQAAAGALATSGPSFAYETGPDGRRYAVGGEVSIDTSPVSGDPEATVRKLQQVRSAALAPASPSAQDRRVAAQATAAANEARAEAAREPESSPSATPSAASNSATSSASSGPAHEIGTQTQETGRCPTCGGTGHGPEAHDHEHIAPVDLFA